MGATIRHIDLPRKQFEYLDGSDFLSREQLGVIRQGKWRSPNSVSLQLPDEVAEEFREVFTNQLAKVGFDEAYEATEEGGLLEDLIDLFGRDEPM